MVDLALAGVFVLAVINGWRRGVLGTVGSVGGLALGAVVARGLLANMPNPLAPFSPRSLATWLAVAGLCLSIGAAIGAWIGRELHNALPLRSLRRIDNGGGAVANVGAWAVVVWVVASALGGIPSDATQQAVGDSRIVGYLDARMPAPIRAWYSQVHSQLSLSSLPTGIVGSLIAPQVEAPVDSLLDDAQIATAVKSVVRVEGVSTSCSMRVTGTGFVAAAHHVVTNAHVVAGTDSIGVRIAGLGKLKKAKVVYIDPATDIAVLYVPTLDSVPLKVGSEKSKGESLVVTGFPAGGRLSLIPARVRGAMPSQGTDIYGKNPVRRTIYSLRADIQHGDSGAPLIDKKGEVVGVVFASSATDQQTGYALMPSAISTALKNAGGNQATVDTGACVRD